MKLTWFLLPCAVVAACAVQDVNSIVMAPRAAPQTQEEIRFMSAFFNDIQAASIAERREYCGLIGLDANAAFVATPPRKGRTSSCLPPNPANVDFVVLASYHTHGAWSPEYLTELPSFEDMATDIEDGTDGYVATPGGRLWYIDARARVAREICGRACLTDDPNYRPDPDFPLQKTYGLEDLRAF